MTALITSGLIQPFDYSIGLLRLIADCLISDSPIPAHAGVVESSMSSVMRGSSLERLASHLTCLGVALHLDVDIQGFNIHAHSTSCVAYKYINKRACTIWCLLMPLHSGFTAALLYIGLYAWFEFWPSNSACFTSRRSSTWP